MHYLGYPVSLLDQFIASTAMLSKPGRRWVISYHPRDIGFVTSEGYMRKSTVRMKLETGWRKVEHDYGIKEIRASACVD